MKPPIRVVEDGTQALNIVQELNTGNYSHERIYVFAHDENRTHTLANAADESKQISANLFRSRGEELRAKICSMGFSEEEAAHYEEELDRGNVLVINIPVLSRHNYYLV